MDHKFSSDMKSGAAAALPIVIGYIPAAIAFGLLSKTTGVSFTDSFLFSIMVFAGASQFMALNLIAASAAVGEIVIATLLLNLRHFLMSASLAVKFDGKSKKWLPLVAFGVTDETFSVAVLRKEKPSVPFLLALEGISYSAWVGGTIFGYLVGSALPVSVQSSIGIALYAMFAAILVPEIKKSVTVAAMAFGAGMINALLTFLNWLPSGWNIIIATVLAAGIGAVFSSDKSEEVLM